MNSENEGFHKKKRGNLIWKVTFIILLVVNLGLVRWVLSSTDYGRDIGLVTLLLLPWFVGVLAIVDLIIIVSYIFIQHPQGISRIISYIALIPLTLALMYSATGIYQVELDHQTHVFKKLFRATNIAAHGALAPLRRG